MTCISNLQHNLVRQILTIVSLIFDLKPGSSRAKETRSLASRRPNPGRQASECDCSTNFTPPSCCSFSEIARLLRGDSIFAYIRSANGKTRKSETSSACSSTAPRNDGIERQDRTNDHSKKVITANKSSPDSCKNGLPLTIKLRCWLLVAVVHER